MLKIMLHNSLIRELSRARLAECERAIAELESEQGAAGEGNRRVELVRHPDGMTLIRVPGAADGVMESIAVDNGPLEAFFDAYEATMRAIDAVDRSAQPRGLEALEYARRVAHDEAALWLRKQVRPLIDLSLHEARVVFTLIFLSCAERHVSGLACHRDAAAP